MLSAEELKNVVVDALDEVKGVDIRVLDVREKSSFADLMVIATGTSDRHVKALAGKVQEKCREAGERPIGVEGERVEGDHDATPGHPEQPEHPGQRIASVRMVHPARAASW